MGEPDGLEGEGGFGWLLAALAAGAVVVGATGVYALKKAGVQGSKVWLGLGAVPLVWYGLKMRDNARAQRGAYAPLPAQNTVAPRVTALKELSGTEMLDMLAMGQL